MTPGLGTIRTWTSSPSSFWLVSPLTIVSEAQRAPDMMERLLRIAPPLGLCMRFLRGEVGTEVGTARAFPALVSDLPRVTMRSRRNQVVRDGRYWARTRSSADSLRRTPGDSSGHLQEKGGSGSGKPDQLGPTGSDSAVGQQVDGGESNPRRRSASNESLEDPDLAPADAAESATDERHKRQAASAEDEPSSIHPGQLDVFDLLGDG
jgi:hypothetical protein